MTIKEMLNELMAEVEAVEPETYATPVPMEPDDTVIGYATEEQKKVFTLRNRYADLLQKAQMTFMFGGEMTEEQKRQASDADGKHAILDSLFWASLRASVGGVVDNIGIRAGWQIVTKPEEKRPRHNPLEALLASLGETPKGAPVPVRRGSKRVN